MNQGDYFLMSREWRAVRMRVLERDGAKCACCGATAANGAVMNVDHIKPRIRYPELALTESNLQVLCDACNHGKGNTFETDWRGEKPAAMDRSIQMEIRDAQLAIVKMHASGAVPEFVEAAQERLAELYKRVSKGAR